MPWTSVKSIVLLSLVLGLYLWFRRAQQVLKERWDAVTVASQQRQAIRSSAETRRPEEFAAVLERSESIYTQAVTLYHKTLERPLYWLPATIMGYRPLMEDDGFSEK